MPFPEDPPPGCQGLPTGGLPPAWLGQGWLGTLSRRRLAYALRVLTAEELRVIQDPRDAVTIARIKRMPSGRLARFDALVPADQRQQRFYQSLQLAWLRDEEYLLGTQLGRSPTQRELFIDFMKHHNGVRFRAYFALKYPDRMRRMRKGDASPPPA